MTLTGTTLCRKFFTTRWQSESTVTGFNLSLFANLLCRYTLSIEAVSCDELYVDLTELVLEFGGQVQDIVGAMRADIKVTTNFQV